MRTISEICTEWDWLYWEPDRPRISGTRFAFGSHGAPLQMLYEVVGETCGDFQCCDKLGDKFCSGDDLPFIHHCRNEAAFLEKHDHDVRRLKQKFKHLRKDIRIVLMQWFLGRDTQMLFADMSCRFITTKYSDSVRFAHFEYGELMYPKNAGMCRCCGVIFDKKE
uniref:Uncharacterized protein n=1 Tax=Pseudictyota dubia TaxID=2749911 RepID=A0A7R9W766_9STRA|mmetsp:Transcript_36593/g.67703  ORF Transcript_36593/g.67703 Transcript_36593/m.67703 type:complete len:165 (+) Transcript_36593:544-1038(+)